MEERREIVWLMQLAGIRKGEKYRGWLWVSLSKDVVSVHIDRHRSVAARQHLFRDRSEDEPRPVLVSDRYSAYKKLARELECEQVLCWVHVHREFNDACAGGGVRMQHWKDRWMQRFGELFHANKKRLEACESVLPMARQSEVFRRSQGRLEALMMRFFDHAEAEL